MTSLTVFVVAVMSYRSQPDVTGLDMMMEAAGSLECHRETAAYSKSAHNSLSDLTGKTGSLRCMSTCVAVHHNVRSLVKSHSFPSILDICVC